MSTMTGKYTGGLHCEMIHNASGSVLMTDAPIDNYGKGESFSPTDLVGVSLITCMATLMGIQANALKLDISDMTLKISKEMSEDKPRRIRKLVCDFLIPCHATEREKALLQKAAETCPVNYSLSPEIEKVVNFTWLDE